MDCILFIWFFDSGKYELEQIVTEGMILMQITFALILSPVPECPA